MKIGLYLGVFLLSLTNVLAQENRGTLIPAKIIGRSVMVGGSVSGSYKKVSDTYNNEPIKGHRQQMDFDAKVGYFILHDVAIGLRGSLYHRRENMDGKVPTNATNILAGPFARFYLDKGFFTEASAAAGMNISPNKFKSELLEFRGGVGYALFINPKVAVEPAVMLSYFRENKPTEGNRKIVEFGPSLNIGLQIYLFRERKFTLTPR